MKTAKTKIKVIKPKVFKNNKKSLRAKAHKQLDELFDCVADGGQAFAITVISKEDVNSHISTWNTENSGVPVIMLPEFCKVSLLTRIMKDALN